MHFVLFKKYLNGNDIFKFINPNDLEDFQRQLSVSNKINAKFILDKRTILKKTIRDQS